MAKQLSMGVIVTGHIGITSCDIDGEITVIWM
jgi:hypothetical protein